MRNLRIVGNNVHNVGSVGIAVEAVCDDLLWLRLTYNEPGKKRVRRKTLDIHLEMANALTLADSIKNAYLEKNTKNFKHLVKKLAGYSLG